MLPSRRSLILNLSVQVHHFEFIHHVALRKAKRYRVLRTDLFEQMGYHDPKGEALLVGALLEGIGDAVLRLKGRRLPRRSRTIDFC